MDVIGPRIADGSVENVGEQYVEGWLPEQAQRVTEQLLTAERQCGGRGRVLQRRNGRRSRGGARERRLARRAGLGPGRGPGRAQPGGPGLQTVSVWKDARVLGGRAAQIAMTLLAGEAVAEAVRWDRGPRGIPVDAILLDPIPITRDNLGVVIEAGWAPREAVCQGVAEPPPACR